MRSQAQANRAGSSGLPESAAPDLIGRSYTITAEVEVPQGGGEGMITTLGGRFGGYGLYLLKGRPVFTYNFVALERFRWEGQQALTPGKHTIVFDFTYEGPGFGKGGTGVLKVDGRDVATRKIPHTIPFLTTFDETFDVGMDTRTPVDDNDYQVPFLHRHDRQAHLQGRPATGRGGGVRDHARAIMKARD